MTSPFGCHACQDAGHWAAACPELAPPQTRAEYDQRFAKYVEWFHEGRITARQKQDLIRQLNSTWKAKKEKEKAR